jgi:hypothetical protein
MTQVRYLSTVRVQADEVWSFCYSKEKNTSADMKAKGAGSVWTGPRWMRIRS